MPSAEYWTLHSSTIAGGLFPPEKGKLHIVGEHFYTEAGDLFPWRGLSLFMAYHDFRAGVDIRPRLRWCRQEGVNLIRVFGAVPWKEREDAWIENFSRDQLPAFFQLTTDEGVRVEYVPECYQYRKFKKPDGTEDRIYRLAAEQRLDLQETYDIADRFDLVLVEDSNEPHVNDIDILELIKGINKHLVLSASGIYTPYTGTYPTEDYSTIHTQRDDAWHRKARHAQEVQAKTKKPCISDEPAKAIEPDFSYPGGKTNPDEFVWHHGVCALWTNGSTLHTEEGKWGRVPKSGMRQYQIVEAVRDHVWLKIGPEWQTGSYAGAHMSKSPVDGKGLKINGKDIWTYSSVHDEKALAVRCAVHAPQPKPGWTVADRWGPGGSIVRLER